MMDPLKFLQWLTIVLTGLVAGVFWGTWFTLTRSIENFPPESFILIGKTIIQNVAFPMQILMPLTLLCILIDCWLMRKIPESLFWNIAALLLMVITLLITVLIEVPIDNQINTWTTDLLPADWQDLREKWTFFHTIRTFDSLGSLCMVVYGNLLYHT